MPSEPMELLKLDDGSKLITSPKQDEYWVVGHRGDRRKISLQEACQIWIRYHSVDAGSHPLHAADFGNMAHKVPAQPPPIPQNDFRAPPRHVTKPPPVPAAPTPAPQPLQEASERESWSDSLLRKLGLDSSSIEDAVAADRRKLGV